MVVTKILNDSSLTYKQIGVILDEINSIVDTNYVGKWMYYEMEIGGKKVHVETVIQKTQFKIFIEDI